MQTFLIDAFERTKRNGKINLSINHMKDIDQIQLMIEDEGDKID